MSTTTTTTKTQTATTTMTAAESTAPAAKVRASMKTEPGRIGALTPSEEVKLKEMWSYLLVESGISDESLCQDAREAGNKFLAATKSKESAGSEKKQDKKKSGGGWFGFRKGSTSSNEETSVADTENMIQAARKKYHDAVKDYSVEELKRALFQMYKADNPDNLILRFLRARKWNVAEALGMLGETISWRLDFDVESLTQKGELGALENKEDGLMLQFRSKKAYSYGFDKKGRPIVHVRPRFHDPKAQSEEDIQKFTVSIIENARLCLQDPVDTAAVIFDLSDFSLSNMDYPAVKFIIKCFEGHYPESLGFILIHKAPWIFQGIWNIIKNWIDPVVAAKISFTKNSQDMNEYIESQYIPKELGGEREYEYEYEEPVEGENRYQEDEDTRNKIDQERLELGMKFQQATIDWIRASDQKSSDEAQQRKDAITRKLQEAYWRYDPYGRGRTILDRNGQFKFFQGENIVDTVSA